MFLDRVDAGKKLGRSPFTIRDWQYAGLLTPVVLGDPPCIHYEASELLAAAREMQRRYRERPCVAGPGRGHKSSKRPAIAHALGLGHTVEETAHLVGVSVALVRAVRREQRANEKQDRPAQKRCPETK